MIPKKIHYCWFGENSLPDLAKKCIESWKKYCPDYEIIEWNESNYDVRKNLYMEEAYEAEKWAFVSDYARLDIIYNYGGIYLDTDVELLKKLDDLLNYPVFLATEKIGLVATGLIFGAEPKNESILMMLNEYKDAHFKIEDKVYDLLPCPKRNTKPFLKIGLKKTKEIQNLGKVIIFPPEYFCPMDNETKEVNITLNTYSIHHYGASWISQNEKKMQQQFDIYDKNNSKIMAMILKAKYEYKMTYDKLKMKYIFNFIKNRLKKRKIRKKVEK